jgi:hypothetical protein
MQRTAFMEMLHLLRVGSRFMVFLEFGVDRVVGIYCEDWPGKRTRWKAERATWAVTGTQA